MAYCANCANRLIEGQKFCPACGHAAAAAAAPSGPADAGGPEAPAAEEARPAGPSATTPPAAPPPPASPPPAAPLVQYAPSPEAVPYQQGWSYYPQSEPPASPSRPSRKGVWIGIAAAIVVIAAVCGLVFGISGGDTSGAGSDISSGVTSSGGGDIASGPEGAVRQLMVAIESKDVDTVFDLLDPQSMSMLLDGQSEALVKQMLKAVLFGQKSITLSNVELRTKQTSDTTATVTIIAGKVTVSHASGEKETYDVSDLPEPPAITLVKRGGSWLVDAASAVALVANAGGLSGDGAEEVVTTTTTLSGTDGTRGSATTKTTSSSEDTATSTTVFTPSTGAGAGHGGTPVPEQVVLRFFRAMEQKDMAAVFALFDPDALQKLTGRLPIEAFIELMGKRLFESLFDFQSIEVNDVELKVVYTSDSTALVTVVAGTATITDAEGKTVTEDLTESMGAAEFSVVKRGHAWYMVPDAMF